MTARVRRAVEVILGPDGSTYGTAQYWNRLAERVEDELETLRQRGDIPADYRPRPDQRWTRIHDDNGATIVYVLPIDPEPPHDDTDAIARLGR